MQGGKASGSTPWDRYVTMLTAKAVSGAAILPVQPTGDQRKGLGFSQRGLSMKAPEAASLVEAIMNGKLHKDYVTVGGLQYIITTVGDSAYYGVGTSTQGNSGIIIVKRARVCVLAVYAEPTTQAEAILHVHAFTDTFDAAAI